MAGHAAEGWSRATRRCGVAVVTAGPGVTDATTAIANAWHNKSPMLVIGGRDMEAGQVSVRLHHGGPQGAKPKAEVVADILASIKERRA